MIPDWMQNIYKTMLCPSMYGHSKIKYLKKNSAFEVHRVAGHTKYLIDLYKDGRRVGSKYLDTAGAGFCFLAWGDNWDDEGRIIKSDIGDIL